MARNLDAEYVKQNNTDRGTADKKHLNDQEDQVDWEGEHTIEFPATADINYK